MAAKNIPKQKENKRTRKKTRRKIQAFAFIDTNIFLDFYRGRNEASLSLLEKLEKVRDRIICTYQVEMEFLKNRQNAVCRIFSDAKFDISSDLPAVLADTNLANAVQKAKSDISKQRNKLRDNLQNLLAKPSQDRVLRVLDHIFENKSDHVLTRNMDVRHKIKRLARRRYQLGYPPRKSRDTSMGDAFNWEWIIYCAKELKLPGRFIIVSRDSDFGCKHNSKFYLNDQLKREFRERVGRKSIVYTHKLSDALREFDVRVTQKEEESEDEVISEIRKVVLRDDIGSVADSVHANALDRVLIDTLESDLRERYKEYYAKKWQELDLDK